MEFTTNGTFKRSGVVTEPETGETFSLGGKRGSSAIFEATEDDRTLVGGDAAEAFVYDLTLNKLNALRFFGFERFELGQGDDVLDLTVRPGNEADAYERGVEAEAEGGDDVMLGTGQDDVLAGNLVYPRNYWEDDLPPDKPITRDGSDTIYGGGGNDTLAGNSYDPGEYFGEGDAFIRPNAGDGDDWIYGGAGDDVISGADTSVSEDGSDEVPDKDHLYGGDGNDTITGESATSFVNNSDDFIYGGAGDDNLYGEASVYFGAIGEPSFYIPDPEAGDDHIYGGDGADRIFGDGGQQGDGDPASDVIQGGKGDDILYGDGYRAQPKTADTFIFEPGDGVDRLRYFESGYDTIDLTAWGFESFRDLKFQGRGTPVVTLQLDEDDAIVFDNQYSAHPRPAEGDFIFA
ncbi:calcium-binding protein [Marinivivus vitaminiproducens]|uniref:calcium-binding protein n=1 Tax=Marinivivus vitaminiproducens TaxID=3035935 RepID=UPI002797E4A6|nr:hypothetical protein P4R82_22900 [Geminicoccaceae bacterium SCSIO 64248]